MKTITKALCTFAILKFSIMFGYGQDIEPTFTPGDSSLTSITLTGTLTHASNSIPQNTEVGHEDTTGVTVAITWKDGGVTVVPCCVDVKTKENGSSFQLLTTDMIVTITNGDTISLPKWDQRAPNPLCDSAANEWNRWYGLVKTHEEGHRTVEVTLYTKDEITPVVKPVLATIKTKCYSNGDTTPLYKDLNNQLQAEDKLVVTAIDAEEKKRQDAYHAKVGKTIPNPDTSKDCS